MVLPEAVWYSVVSDTADDRRFLCATRFSTRRPRSVSLHGLPLRSRAVVAPRRFHFTIIALTYLVGKKFNELTCGKDGIL